MLDGGIFGFTGIAMYIGHLIRKQLEKLNQTIVRLAEQLAYPHTNVFKIFEKNPIASDVSLQNPIHLSFDFLKHHSGKAKKALFLLILLMNVCHASSQKLPNSLQIHFPINSTSIDTLYMKNGESLSSFYDNNLARFNHPYFKIKKVKVVGSASPDGRLAYNESLALQRAYALSDYIQERLSLDKQLMEVSSIGADWPGLQDLVNKATEMPNRAEILSILQKNFQHNARLWWLKQVNRGIPYRWMSQHLLPQLRQAKVIVYYEIKALESAPIEIVPKLTDVIIKDTAVLVIQKKRLMQPKQCSSHEIFFIKSNLLLPLGNVGLEVPIGNSWSVGADFYYPWLKRKSDHKNCIQALMWNLEGRYWLGKNRTWEDVLEGHSVGFNVMAGYYDLEKNYEGYQGEFVNFSFDYTYGMPIFNDKLHLEFTIGLGYFFSQADKYDVFEEGGKGYRRGYKENFHYLGPNKMGVSIVVPIKSGRRK